MKIFQYLFFILGAGTATLGQLPGNPEKWCREGFFTKETESFGVRAVKVNRSKFFSDDGEKCPASNSCETSSYVIKGDKVITNRNFGEYTCAWFSSRTGGVKVGWLKTADLSFADIVNDGGEKAWLGTWNYASSTIKLSKTGSKGILQVNGDSYWQGLGDNIHIGELNAKASFADGVLRYTEGASEYDCNATMRIAIEKYLIVADNGNCGGANVTFSGIYRKMSEKLPPRKK